MIRFGAGGRSREHALVEHSPLRCADPRAKLAMSLCVSLAVMLPLQRLVLAMALYALLLTWSGLIRMAAWQVWRLKWVLLALFLVDWIVVDLELALVVPLRLIFLAGAFTLFFATTTPGELRLALEWLRVPYPYAFSLSLAFQSLGLLDEEWRGILEAQRARGAWVSVSWKRSVRSILTISNWRKALSQLHGLVALTVPAIVMTTKRAWGMTEAAYARGFDSPRRRAYRRLQMALFDWFLLACTLGTTITLLLWS